MNISPLQLARVPDLLTANLSTSQINSTQVQLIQVESQLSTGKLFSEPSQNPSAASATMGLQRTLDSQTLYLSNLTRSHSQLGEVDSTLSDLTALIQQAQNIASADLSSTIPASQKQSDAAVVDSIYTQALAIANKQFNDNYLFGGDNNTTPPYLATPGGVQFVGSNNLLENTVDTSASIQFMIGGPSVFGGTSSEVQGTADLTPNLTAATRLSDLGGATSAGVRRGAIQISNGTTSTLVDLSKADNVGDVINAINNAGVGGITAAISGTGITLSGAAGDNISVTDVSGGTTAADLGILRPNGAGAGTPLAGAGTQPHVTLFTPLGALKGGTGIDPTGITISNGAVKTNISFAGDNTIGDLLNSINGSNAKVQAQINANGTGINIVNPTQGVSITISENGGTSGADLGVRSFSPQSKLSELNSGKGVQLATTGNDFQITLSDGTSFGVALAGSQTVQDVIDKINTAAGGAGFSAGFSATSNGITLADSSGGAGAFTITSANGSNAAVDLGVTTAPVAGVITGTDVNPISAPGLFSNLTSLRNSLQSGDTAGITNAAQGLQVNFNQVVQVRAVAGGRVQEIQSRQSQLQDEQTATQSLMSQLSDTDFTAAITKFQTLQTSLQATLETTAKTLSLSLLNFLG